MDTTQLIVAGCSIGIGGGIAGFWLAKFHTRWLDLKLENLFLEEQNQKLLEDAEKKEASKKTLSSSVEQKVSKAWDKYNKMTRKDLEDMWGQKGWDTDPDDWWKRGPDGEF